jgi:hypothetical protein
MLIDQRLGRAAGLRVEIGIRMSRHCEMKFGVFNGEVKGERRNQSWTSLGY